MAGHASTARSPARRRRPACAARIARATASRSTGTGTNSSSESARTRDRAAPLRGRGERRPRVADPGRHGAGRRAAAAPTRLRRGLRRSVGKRPLHARGRDGRGRSGRSRRGARRDSARLRERGRRATAYGGDPRVTQVRHRVARVASAAMAAALPALVALLVALVAFLGLVAPAQARMVAGLTVSPLPGTPDASPTTQISLLGTSPSNIVGVRARGARSGVHRGVLRPYSSGDGASFLPARRFAQGEVVSVRVTTAIGGKRRSGFFRFRVGGHAALVLRPGPAPPSTTRGTHHYVSRPDLHPAAMQITERREGRAAGHLFVSTILAPGHNPPVRGQAGPMIFDDQGQLVWLSPSPRGSEAFNLRMQSYRGAPALTWWEGRLSFLGLGFGEDVIADSSYNVVARVHAGNGYHADLHEFTVDRRDSAWMTIYVPVLVRRGGRRVALLDSIVQRVDIPTGLVMFEWHSLGHISLGESYVKPPRGPLPWDPYHVNSIEVDRSGNLLLSNRNTWAVYKVSGRTGGILWRLGGKRSSFRLSRHARFAWQHDAHQQPDGTITLFDDEAAPRAGHESRGITLALSGRRAQL